MSARFERMVEQAEREVSQEYATRIKALFERKRDPGPNARRIRKPEDLDDLVLAWSSLRPTPGETP